MAVDIQEPMFSAFPSEQNADILIGMRPNRMLRAIERILELSTRNPLVTYISGAPGSGKSHTLYHLQYISHNEKKRYMVIINANQSGILDDMAILRHIHGDICLRYDPQTLGISGDSSILDKSGFIGEINAAMKKIKEIENARDDYGLIIAIDGLDELARTKQIDTSQLLIYVRLLLDYLNKACFILSMTHDILEDARKKYFTEDRTFMRRFIGPQEYDGTPLNFEGFNLNETQELCDKNKQRWLQRRLDSGDISQETHTQLAGNHDWPFSREAISLAWKVTVKTPSVLLDIFNEAFSHLRSEHADCLSLGCAINVGEMATIILRMRNNINITTGYLNELEILNEPDKYFTRGPTGDEGNADKTAQIFGDLIQRSFGKLKVEFTSRGGGYYVVAVTDAVKKQFKFGLFLMETAGSNQADEVRQVQKLYEYTAENIMSSVPFILAVKLAGTVPPKGIYGDLPPIKFIRGGEYIARISIQNYGRHLGNYTYLMHLGDAAMGDILSCLDQKNLPHYLAMLDILDNRCGIRELNIPLSAIIMNIMRYVNPGYNERGALNE